MIDATKIPLLDLGKISALEAAAGKLKSVGGHVTTTGANVHSTFQGLSGFYDAPEAELLFNSTRPVKTQSETFGHDTTGVGAALATFAAEIRPIATRLQALHGKAVAFQNEVKGDDNWQDDDGKVDQNNQLLHDINGAVVQLMAAERKAANAIEAAFGGTRRWHAGNSQKDPNAYGVNSIPDDANTPWGSHEEHRSWWDKATDWVGDHVVPDWGWAQSAWSGYSSFLKGFWVDGVWGTLTGLYKLSTMNAILDPNSFAQAWKGVGLLGLDGAMWATPALGAGMTLAAKSGTLPKPVANVVNEANSTGVNFAKGLVAWDEWSKDPARAGGAVTFNVVTAVIPGPKGGGAMAKLLGGLGEDAGKVGVAAEDASRAGTVAEDAGKLGDIAETAPKVDLPTAGDLARDFDVPRLGDDLPNVGDHAPETPSLPEHDPVPARPGAAHDPAPLGGAHDPTPPTRDPLPPGDHDPAPPGGVHDPVPPAHDPAPPGDHGPAPPGHDPVAPNGEHPTPDHGHDAQGGGGEDGGGSHGGTEPPPLGDLPNGGWRGEGGLELDSHQNAVANSFLDRARSAEPHITHDVSSFTHEVPGAKMAGLEYKLKGADSLKRKIAADLLENRGQTVNEVVSNIKDSVRYTMQVPDAAYSDGVRHVISDMQSAGYKNVSFKNFWSGHGYQGINSTWRDPATGQVFELQFHTESSLTAKMATHELYEKLRLPGVPPAEVARLESEMQKIFGQVHTPPGAEGLRAPGKGR